MDVACKLLATLGSADERRKDVKINNMFLPLLPFNILSNIHF